MAHKHTLSCLETRGARLYCTETGQRCVIIDPEQMHKAEYWYRWAYKDGKAGQSTSSERPITKSGALREAARIAREVQGAVHVYRIDPRDSQRDTFVTAVNPL